MGSGGGLTLVKKKKKKYPVPRSSRSRTSRQSPKDDTAVHTYGGLVIVGYLGMYISSSNVAKILGQMAPPCEYEVVESGCPGCA